MKRLGVLVTVALLILIFTQASIAASPGMGARAMGMGGAFTAVADDGTAAYWNPAGITQFRFGVTPTFGGVGDWQGITDLLQKVEKFEGIKNYDDLGALGISEANLALNAGVGLNFSGFALNVFGDADFSTSGLHRLWP